MLSRLRVSHKLLLIYALDMVAVIFLGSVLASEKLLSIDFARKELAGQTYIDAVRDVLFTALDHEATPTPDAARRLDEALDRLESTDARLGDGLHTADLRPAVATAGRQSRDSATAQPLIGALRPLIARVGDQSNLILDPDLDSYYAMSLTLLRFPALVGVITDLDRAIAEASHTEHLDVEPLTRLLLLEGRLAAVVQGIDEDLAAAIRSSPDGSVRRSLAPPFAALSDSLARTSQQMRGTLTSGRLTAGDARALDGGIDVVLAATRDAWAASSGEVRRLLAARIEAQFERMAFHFGAAGLLLIAILAAVLTLARRIAVPLARLADAADRLRLTGDYSIRVDWSSGDEIGRLATAFNRMVEGLDSGDRAQRLLHDLEIAQARLIENNVALEKASRLVLDSIGYARKIQDGLLPDATCLGDLVAELYVSWQPLQQVGGDYYWLHRFGNRALILLADCTGHGVPGAFMTVVVASALDRILREQDVALTPSALLERLDRVVRERLRQDRPGAASDDGLDGAICLWDAETRTVTFAGANLALLAMQGGQLSTLKGTRRSLGYRPAPGDEPFAETVIPVGPGDAFYLFTDGMTDHVGGEPPRLFGRRRLAEVIEAARDLPLPQQLARMEETLADYRGPQQRRDDMTIIAFRPLAFPGGEATEPPPGQGQPSPG